MPLQTHRIMNMNGRLVDKSQCNVFAFANVVKYGVGVFEGIRAYRTEARQMLLFRAREHLDRLVAGCRAMDIDLATDSSKLVEALVNTIRANAIDQDVHVRIISFVGSDETISAMGPADFVIGIVPMASALSAPAPMKLGVSSITRISDNALPPRVKCVANYVNNRCAAIEAARCGFDGPIMLTQLGHVSESTGACIFLVRDGQLITPDVTSDILESITRASIIEIAQQKLGLKVVERAVAKTELYFAEEAFQCGTAHEIQPIVSVDGRIIGNGKEGPITERLRKCYDSAVHGKLSGFESWYLRL